MEGRWDEKSASVKLCGCVCEREIKMCDVFVYIQCSGILQQASSDWNVSLVGFYCLTLHSSHNMIQSQHSLSDNKWRTDKVTFLRLFSLINMFWLAVQSHRQTESCRISGASKWVTVSCIDRKWGLLWGQRIDFLACQVWEYGEKSGFLSRRIPCQLSDSPQSLNCYGERLFK